MRMISMKDNEIKVSVICLTYNHEDFITDALDGFVNQKTDFKYEVIVHDDASTDKTPDIIRKYEKEHPDMIRPIYQTQNQYSKGGDIIEGIIYPRIKGKYIALCEGDDHWCSDSKLQKQVDFLESHPEYTACTHSSMSIDIETGLSYTYHPVKHDCDILARDIFDWGDNRFHTASLMYRTKYMYRPPEFRLCNVGDLPTAIWLVINGKIRYLKDTMSVYRRNVPGSWTRRTAGNVHDNISHITDCIKMYKNIDCYTNGKYHCYISRAIRKYELTRLVLSDALNRGLYKEYQDVMKRLPVSTQIKYWLMAYLPLVWNVLCFVRKIVRGSIYNNRHVN